MLEKRGPKRKTGCEENQIAVVVCCFFVFVLLLLLLFCCCCVVFVGFKNKKFNNPSYARFELKQK